MNIQDLPNETMTKIAGYLTFPSQAIVAVALTAESAKFRTINDESQMIKVSKEIVTSAISSSDDWDTVDFGDIESSLAARLSDDDIESIFVSLLRCELDHRVRSVIFTGCTGIKGKCIRPLRYFANLLQVDLSLVGRNSGTCETDVCSLEQDAVVETLHLHVRTWGWLKLVRLPEKFLREPSAETRQFLHQLNEIVERRGGVCSNCDATLGFGVFHRAIVGADGGIPNISSSIIPCYGRSTTCCGGCLDDFCPNSDCQLLSCKKCGTSSCRECVSFDVRCHICLDGICNNCGEVNNGEFGIYGLKRCYDCEEIACEDCLDSCSDCDHTWCLDCTHFMRCERCDKKYCDRCESGVELGITWCEYGEHCFCKQCRMEVCIEEEEDDCEACMALIGREAVAMAILYKAENELNTIAISGLELTVKEHEEEIATLRKKVQEQEEEIKRLKGGDSDETVPHIEGAKES